MSPTKELCDFLKNGKALKKEIDLAQWIVNSSQMAWTKLVVDITDLQMLLLVEDHALDRRLKQIGARLVADNPIRSSESATSPIVASYEGMINNVKWMRFQKRLSETNAAFYAVKTVWANLTEDFTTSMPLPEIRMKIMSCKQREGIAAYWTSKYGGLMDEWKNIKGALDKGIQTIQHCIPLAAVNKTSTEEGEH